MKIISKIFDLQKEFFMNSGLISTDLHIDIKTYNKLLKEYNTYIKKAGGLPDIKELQYIFGLEIIMHLSKTKVFEVE